MICKDMNPNQWYTQLSIMKLLFVPGFKENMQSRDYNSTLEVFSELGYDPVFVNINWRRTSQGDWVNQLEEARCRVGFDIPLAGFSFGAVTALLSTSKCQPSQLWLFSLSPLFAEYENTWTKTDKKMCGKKRLDVASKMSLADITPVVACPTVLMVGDKETVKWPEMLRVFETAKQTLPNVHSSIIENTGHDVTSPAYIDEIHRTNLAFLSQSQKL